MLCKRFAVAVGAVVVALLLSEGGIGVYFYFKEGHWISAKQMFKDHFYFDAIGSQPGCTWGDEIALHPQLLYYYRSDSECASRQQNNYGLTGPDIPLEKDTKFYNILLTGASVAELIGHYATRDGWVFQHYLNQNWHSPTGKPFKVINVAVAGMNETNIFAQNMLFGYLADLAISIQGYNEHFALGEYSLFESPGDTWVSLQVRDGHPLLYHSFKAMTWWIRSDVGERMQNSYLNFFISLQLTKLLQVHWRELAHRLDPYPSLPPEWTEERREQYYLARYAQYLKTTALMYKSNKAESLVFIQPAPLLYKVLTPEEKALAIFPKSAVAYKKISTFLDALPQSEVPHENIMRIFENHPETLYVDHIHTSQTGEYIMIEEIGKRMAKRYGWKTKKN